MLLLPRSLQDGRMGLVEHSAGSPLLKKDQKQAPVVQRPDNFILWISHYPTVSICVKISVFSLVQANIHTLTTVKFGSVLKPHFRP